VGFLVGFRYRGGLLPKQLATAAIETENLESQFRLLSGGTATAGATAGPTPTFILPAFLVPLGLGAAG
jgi:hypothetical protein